MHSEDDDSLRNRLQHYQEDPDDSTWDRIQARLPADGIVGQRLSMYQELPDEDVWKNIDRALSVYRHARRWEWVADGAVVVSLLLLLVPVFYPIDFKPGEKLQPVISEAQVKRETSASIDLRSTPEERTGSTPTNNAIVRESQRQLVNDGQQLSRAQGDMKLSDLDQLFVHDTSRDTQKLVVNRNEDAEMPTALLESDQEAAKSEKQLLDLQGETDSVAASTELLKAKKKGGESDRALPESEKGKRTSDRGSLYMLAMPTLGYQQVTPVKDDGIVVQGFERLSSFSPRRLGVRVEAGWEKSLTPEFSVTIGALYFQRHQTFVYQFSDTIHMEVYPVEGEPFTFDIKPALQQGTFDYVVKTWA